MRQIQIFKPGIFLSFFIPFLLAAGGLLGGNTLSAQSLDTIPDRVPEEFRNSPRIRVEKQAAKAAGMKLLEGKHVLLVTDLELTEAVRNLPRAVDEAYPQMCAFFGVEEDPEWKLTVFLMKDREKFQKAGFIPEILPPFKNGFSFNFDCWVCEQPSDYYRQHLVLHEMVHSFSSTCLGNAGPDWFAEGMAEFLGMHDFSASPIQLGFMPPNRSAVPYCGRIREIRDAARRGEVWTLKEAVTPDSEDFATNAIYYWSWGLAWFLENHPKARTAFHALIPHLHQAQTEQEFTRRFLDSLGEDRLEIEKNWLMFTASVDYDFRLRPMLFDAETGVSLQEKSAKERVVQKLRADHGWQNTGIRVEKGDRIRIRAQGRFEIARPDGSFWPCEPNGVTVEYLNGQPLGILQAVILTDAEELTPEIMNDRQEGTFHAPFAVGMNRTLTVPFDGTILLRTNIPPAAIEESRGNFFVEISARK